MFTGFPDLDDIRRETLVDDGGVAYKDFRRSLKPQYGQVWAEFLAGHAGLALTSAAVVAVPTSSVWLPVAVPAGAMALGFGFAYIHLFFHAATHFNLAEDKNTNDLLANLFAGSFAGMDIKAYRTLHFEHHRALGTPGDTERTYFEALDGRFFLESLTGIKLAKVMFGRKESTAARSADRATAPAAEANRRSDAARQLGLGALVHGAVVGTALATGHWPLAVAWVGGVFCAFPFWLAVRQVVEHRSPSARADVDYRQVPHGAYNRLFGDGPIASAVGGAGFNRHLLHHWDPQVPYTRLKELEHYLLRTPIAEGLRGRTTTYARAFLELVRPMQTSAKPQPEAAPTPACLACHSQKVVPWAQSSDTEYKTTGERYSLYRCDACGVLFIDPVPRDRLGVIYPPNYYAYATPSKSIVNRVKAWLDGRLFRKILRQTPGDSLAALDVGGGAGWQLSTLRSLDPRVRVTQVVDLDSGAADVARANGHLYHCGRIEDFEPERRFDVVLMFNLIEHVDDPGKVLTKVRGMLSPGGILAIKTPNYDSLDARLFRDRDWAGYHCPRHWVLFTKESFTALAQRCGLRVASASYTQGAPFWTGSVLTWLDARGITSVTRERPGPYHPAYGPLNAAFAAVDFARMPFSKTSQMFFLLSRDD
jgi:fatty acid desaturase/SAM-dependent methyltransferase